MASRNFQQVEAKGNAQKYQADKVIQEIKSKNDPRVRLFRKFNHLFRYSRKGKQTRRARQMTMRPKTITSVIAFFSLKQGMEEVVEELSDRFSEDRC